MHVRKYCELNEEFMYDREVVIRAMKRNTDLPFVRDVFMVDEEFILQTIKNGIGGALRYVSDRVKCDKELVMKVAKLDPHRTMT